MDKLGKIVKKSQLCKRKSDLLLKNGIIVKIVKYGLAVKKRVSCEYGVCKSCVVLNIHVGAEVKGCLPFATNSAIISLRFNLQEICQIKDSENRISRVQRFRKKSVVSMAHRDCSRPGFFARFTVGNGGDSRSPI